MLTGMDGTVRHVEDEEELHQMGVVVVVVVVGYMYIWVYACVCFGGSGSVGGWIESMCSSYFMCVRMYLRDSIQ